MTRANPDMRASEERWRRISEASHEGIGFAEGGRVVDCNEQLTEMLGYTRAELIGKPVLDLISPQDRDHVARVLAVNSPTAYEHLAVRKDGTTFPVEVRGRSLAQGSRVTAVRDISERERAEAALRRNEELFRAVVEDQTEMIVRWKPDGTRTFVNEAYCRVFGVTAEQAIGTSFMPLVA